MMNKLLYLHQEPQDILIKAVNFAIAAQKLSVLSTHGPNEFFSESN